MADIFKPWRLGDLPLPNHLVRAATWEGMAADDGVPTYDLANLMADLAHGGVGLIVTGMAFISPAARGVVRQVGAHIDAQVGPLTRVSDAAHKSGGRIALQIAHAGGQTKREILGGHTALGPSALAEHPVSKEPVAAMTEADIRQVVEDFALAAGRAWRAEYDAVELHAAHGYLLSQFLSPLMNQRQDAYGGSLENRARLLLEVFDACRQEVGPHFPIMVRLNSEDCMEGGLTLDEAVTVAGWLDRRGVAALDVSGGLPQAGRLGGPVRPVKKPEQEGYFLPQAAAIKRSVCCPVIAVGGFRHPAQVATALDQVDAVAMSRPLVRQPDLPRRWLEGDAAPATCISCSGCFKMAATQGIACAQDQAQ